MKRISTLLQCTACMLAAAATAQAGSFDPSVRPLGSMGQLNNYDVRTECVSVGVQPAHAPAQAQGESFVEKTLNTPGGLVTSTGWLTSSKAPQGIAPNTTVRFNVADVAGSEVTLSAIGIIDETGKMLIASITPDEDTGEFPTEVQESMNSSHRFSILASGVISDANGSKAVAFYDTFGVSGGEADVTIDFNESTRRLAFKAYMGNGQPFPEYQPWYQGCGYNITYGSQLSYTGFYANFSVDDPMSFYVYCNELPATAYYSISYSANLFDDQVYCNLAGGGAINTFANPTNMVETIPASFYDNLSFTMSLSEADYNIPKESFITGSRADIAVRNENGQFQLQTNTLSMGFNDVTRHPVDSYSVYTWVPTTRIATGVQTSMIYTGFAAYNESSSKISGSRTRVGGVEYILPWEQTYNESYDTYTPFSSISRFNIRPATQDLKYFEYPLYAISSLSFSLDEENATKIKGFSCSSNYYGMFHEKMSYSGVNLLKSFAIDGEEKEISEILNVELGSGKALEFTFANPDGFVQGQYTTEALNVLRSTMADVDDIVPPKMVGLQMYNGSGKIKTVFTPGEECNFLVAMYDRLTGNRTNLDFDIALYVAAQDSEEWLEIADPTVTEYDARLGKTALFTIPTDGTLAADKWLKLKVVGTDPAGNTNTMLLDYCLAIGDPGSVAITTADGTAAAPVYYNLQGMRIQTPAAGQIVIEKAGDKTRKVVF